MSQGDENSTNFSKYSSSNHRGEIGYGRTQAEADIDLSNKIQQTADTRNQADLAGGIVPIIFIGLAFILLSIMFFPLQIIALYSMKDFLPTEWSLYWLVPFYFILIMSLFAIEFVMMTLFYNNTRFGFLVVNGINLASVFGFIAIIYYQQATDGDTNNDQMISHQYYITDNLDLILVSILIFLTRSALHPVSSPSNDNRIPCFGTEKLDKFGIAFRPIGMGICGLYLIFLAFRWIGIMFGWI